MATARVQSEPEANLVARVRGGESEAFYELVRPHERRIYLAALSVVNNDADAEEVAQEAILKAFKAIAGFRAEAKFSTWIIQIGDERSANEASKGPASPLRIARPAQEGRR
jgi:RNA polymerase sigma-70 factor, ECF subfamily